MFSRRRFLNVSGASFLALNAGCKPDQLHNAATQEPSSANSNLKLKDKINAKASKELLLGYPINMNTPAPAFFEWRQQLQEAGIGMFAFNNVGNPFKESAIQFNTHDFEREVIQHFGKLYEFPVANTWGFLSHSGTDSNMHGMYVGRTLLKGRTGSMPLVYFTKEAHYSIQILRDLLGLEGVFVDTVSDGGMDADDLRRKLAEHPQRAALVVATVGTTFKGAIDNLDHIQEALKDHISYVHLDAALFGGYLPYTEHAKEVSFPSRNQPEKGRFDSIAVSCHKFFGFPSPAGLFITQLSSYQAFNGLFSKIHNPEYIHHVPGTITCSRDGVKPAEFYHFTTSAALERLTADAKACMANTDYLFSELQARFPSLQPVRANKLSNTIYFKSPGDWMVHKYSLATMHLAENEEYAHVVVMPHVDKKVISEFLADLAQSDKSVIASQRDKYAVWI